VPPPNDPLGEGSGALYSPNALWEFDPATLTQRRPAVETKNYLLRLDNTKLPLDHERAHWFQFCGTTFGTTLMTLTRAEDIAVLELFRNDAADADIRDFARSRLANRDTAFGLSAVKPSGHPALDDLLRRFADARLCRSVLLDSPAELDNDPVRQAVGRALARLGAVYAIHTGRTRPWLSGRLDHRAAEPEGGAIGRPSSLPDFTTRQLLESAAVLNELGPTLMTGWGGFRLRTGTPFTRLERDSYFHVADRLQRLSPRYGRCLDYAFERWAANPALVTGDRAADLGRGMLSLACSFDVALNPPVGPLCPPEALPLADVYPPTRFAVAVEAVASLGFLSAWPNSAEYENYRQRLLDHAGLPLGHIYGRSYQSPWMTGTFFKEAGAEEERLFGLSYFDYLIWAMESLQTFRRDHPLVAALPFLMMFNWTDFSATEAIVAEQSICFGAPFYWVGDSQANHRDLSEAVGIRLMLDLAVLRILKHVVTRPGPCPLQEAFAESLLKDDGFQHLILKLLRNTTQWPDVKELVTLPETGRQEADEKAGSPVGLEWQVPKGAAIRTVRISRQEVQNAAIDGLFSVIAELHEDPLANRSSLELEFSGYDADPRGLWDIPEVRTFLRKFHKVCPIWPWYFYLNPEPGRVVAFALMFFAYLDNPRRVTPEEGAAWIAEVFRGLNWEADHAGADEQLIRQMSSTIVEALKELHPHAADVTRTEETLRFQPRPDQLR
jgi:hypothetical protein